MNPILKFWHFGITNHTGPFEQHGTWGFWPKRGVTLNEGKGPANMTIFWWPNVYVYLAIRLPWRWVRITLGPW